MGQKEGLQKWLVVNKNERIWLLVFPVISIFIVKTASQSQPDFNIASTQRQAESKVSG